ncbi:hypothetical protein CCR75_003361 [Bremia lactucae]|uniref:Uncharacterized protein n=1 Tax=Bremia lactucae TaxID=4779 RepID=A0A976FI59_BRELC|nr:hypothetical protein CCR75_003361 [Bremia lactucae]
MLGPTMRRAAPLTCSFYKRPVQCRFGGSLTKNRHIENWNNWRGDSEKRFQFNNKLFVSMAAWGLIPFGLYYVIAADERRTRDFHNGNPNKIRQ